MTFDEPLFNKEDEALIKSLREGGMARRKAEDQLFTKYVYFIREGMSKYSLPEEEAFDAYSDAILNGIDNIIKGIFENRSSLKTYLFKIFCNRCVDLIRKKTTNKSSIHQTSSISDLLFMIADPAKTVIQHLVDMADTELLKRKLTELGENCKKLLGMFAEGYTDREITVEMSYKSPDVVKTSRLRCLDKLRQLYKQ
ncbi:hypothetical protein BH11BAC3_BH11BAC3_32970 [soil metagenome]